MLSYLPHLGESIDSFVIPQQQQQQPIAFFQQNHQKTQHFKFNNNNITPSKSLNHRYNAGAILFSKLVTNGWKFPYFIFSEADERYLFDIEVNIIYLFILL